MPRSPESEERWRAKAAERRRREQQLDTAGRRQQQAREQRRDQIAARLADLERQAMARFRAQHDDDGETGP